LEGAARKPCHGPYHDKIPLAPTRMDYLCELPPHLCYDVQSTPFHKLHMHTKGGDHESFMQCEDAPSVISNSGTFFSPPEKLATFRNNPSPPTSFASQIARIPAPKKLRTPFLLFLFLFLFQNSLIPPPQKQLQYIHSSLRSDHHQPHSKQSSNLWTFGSSSWLE